MKNNQFIRFLLVGGINTAFSYSVFALLLFLNVHYSIAALSSTILGVLFNFHTTGKLVFDNSEYRLLFKFIGVYTVTYLINLASLRVFDLFKFNMYLAGAILILPMAIIAFILNKKFVFRDKKRINTEDSYEKSV